MRWESADRIGAARAADRTVGYDAGCPRALFGHLPGDEQHRRILASARLAVRGLDAALTGEPEEGPRVVPFNAGSGSRQKQRYPSPFRSSHAPRGGHILGAAGSSPRVRGTLSDWSHLRLLPRFIPACAGNTASREASPTTCPVHPRACGEHIRRPVDPLLVRGSSPRVRRTR